MRSESDDLEAKCPVDPRTREAWLQAAQANNKQQQPESPASILTPPPAATTPLPPAARFSLDTFSWQSQPAAPAETSIKRPKIRSLSTDREISSIPRAISDPSSLNAAEKAALPTNNEVETGQDKDSGNWIYPSQSQFFEAMKRKGHEANPSDMSSIVPIHNAVNERAWNQIKDWEKPYNPEPKLVSFAGDSKKLTPKAYWNMWIMGYSQPFDRHDWVVERDGKKIDYVIDFYKGKDGGMAVPLSFFLDVRPKVNSWEGIRMRIAKTFGWT
ncbi:putative holocytochrome c/c1 synthase [Septoria linicola]|nr:putative holocytochrome c/c1 synthase [Septoria linicola]